MPAAAFSNRVRMAASTLPEGETWLVSIEWVCSLNWSSFTRRKGPKVAPSVMAA